MKENTIVSLADSNYFELLNELIDSIKYFEQSKNIAICILDAGLKDNEKNILIKKVDEIKKAKWDIEVSSYKVKNREWLKSQVSRAFLPEYFPSYKKYLWLEDPNWTMFTKLAARYGFVVDKNIPWRLIADLGSQPMAEYMDMYDTNLDLLF